MSSHQVTQEPIKFQHLVITYFHQLRIHTYVQPLFSWMLLAFQWGSSPGAGPAAQDVAAGPSERQGISDSLVILERALASCIDQARRDLLYTFLPLTVP